MDDVNEMRMWMMRWNDIDTILRERFPIRMELEDRDESIAILRYY
jgi:hypothetical protein